MKLLAIDMDGTCLNSKHKISEKNLCALRAAADAGVIVVPTTGRSLSCLPHQLKTEELYRYVISSNGADVLDTKDNKHIFSASIPYNIGFSLLKEIDNEKIGVTVHIDNNSLVQGRPLSILGRVLYGKDVTNSIRVKNIVTYIREHGGRLEEIQLFYFSDTAYKQVENALKTCCDLNKSFGHQYVELYSKQASKGAAISALANHLNIEPKDIVCIGDGENDLSMFSVAGVRLAMGNAVKELKEQATFVLPSNDNDGVAEAIYKYIL